MEKVVFVKEKMAILKHIISINDIEELNQILEYVENIHKELSDVNIPDTNDFEKWNEQFTDIKDLNEPVEEYSMSLGEFRTWIYESEKSEYFPIEEFQKKLKKLYNES